MSARVSCWLNGHDWGEPGVAIYSDVFGNRWRLSRCNQCGAKRRHLHQRWDAAA